MEHIEKQLGRHTPYLAAAEHLLAVVKMAVSSTLYIHDKHTCKYLTPAFKYLYIPVFKNL